ncbi:flagellin [Nitratiruptor sp. SB155-2]|uniref:flagellin N-terminal helical domain-containing protein n=1 Tax=Nitratiruptor sp. (strain SB155-2) TaxID=387092 RepID=UPI0001586DEF|nr:flagellin [Nitratiruptor sp. SB155-2]BAF69754.1 flagellin [Nitratiruptor sp. SB155-2]
MALRVNYNFQADFGHVNLKKTESRLNTSLERLETGLRINSAKDDAAGLFIADQLGLVSKALDQGSRNANDGISASQIAESTLGQIYDKLTSMYTKASQAANDTNDANARAALQNDIKAITDAIDRMAKAAEFNGKKLLDGTFTNQQIQYGPRAGQSLNISISSVTANNLGAYTVNGVGATGVDTANDYATLTAANTNWGYDSTNDSIKIAGKAITLANDTVDDAAALAAAINGDSDITSKGIEAYASNSSIADTAFSPISAGSDGTTVIKLYVGSDRTEDATITIAAGTELTLNELVDQINAQAGEKVTASNVDGKLKLDTPNGETLGFEVTINGTAANGADSVDLSMLLQGASGTVTAGTAAVTGSAVKVGKLEIMGTDAFTIDHTGVSGTNEGYNFDTATGGTSTLSNLNSLNVTTYDDAQSAMKIINIAIKKVDKSRSDLGSIQQNLQAIIDNNDFAATQTREAESRIRNVDFAKEMSEFTRQQTLMQSGMAMLAQANQLPQMVLQLLR